MNSLDNKSNPPNIVIFYLDDVGYNDWAYSSSDLSQFMPTMIELSSEGIRMNEYYAQQLCTPSRAALLTGKYPIHTGSLLIILFLNKKECIIV